MEQRREFVRLAQQEGVNNEAGHDRSVFSSLASDMLAMAQKFSPILNLSHRLRRKERYGLSPSDGAYEFHVNLFTNHLPLRQICVL